MRGSFGFDHKKILENYTKWKLIKQTFWSSKSKDAKKD
jgi:hypothetical protein